jgi:hypothetical protein
LVQHVIMPSDNSCHWDKGDNETSIGTPLFYLVFSWGLILNCSIHL